MISDKYEIIKMLAKTEHSKVYLVKHKQLKVLRVAKLVYKNQDNYERIINEANFLKNLKSKGIPIIYDVEDNDKSVCIIEEYISGESLDKYLKHTKLSEKQIIKLSISICEILEYLHETAGIAHLDIKPANIMVKNASSDNEFIVHIIDFDSSRRLYIKEKNEKNIKNNERKTLKNRFEIKKNNDNEEFSYGTIGYAAPEQYNNKFCYESDIYSIGVVILYIALFGNINSITDDVNKVCQKYSNSIGPIIRKCLRHNQNQRFSSISSLKKELETILEYLSEKKIQETNIPKFGSKHVYINGMYKGIGTTHLCLCMAYFLAKKNKKVLCIRHNDVVDYKNPEFLKKLNDDGIMIIDGIHICPFFNDTVKYYNEKESLNDIYCEYDYIIHDCGVISVDNYVENSINILVGIVGYGCADIKKMQKNSEKYIVFINHINGSKFYNLVKKLDWNNKVYRFPCVYEWNRENRLLEEAFNEILEFHGENYFWKTKTKKFICKFKKH